MHYLANFQARDADLAGRPDKPWKCIRPKKDGASMSTASASAPPSSWSNNMTRREWIALISAAPLLYARLRRRAGSACRDRQMRHL